MENIETLLAAVAQTQGFDDDEPVVPAPPESELRNSASAAATRLVAGNPRPSPVVETAAPAPSSALSALGPVIGDGEKRKRGRPRKSQLAAYPLPSKRKKVEDEDEDVCFICFDGGSLVLCDRKGCPKAYHPACIKRDEAFFQSKAKWNCGWHICSVCQKTSYFMCYTCTYSLCKACTKNADYVHVRGNKGFCRTCIKPIMLIENKDLATDESVKVDFDDKYSWEYLFKMYWLLLKEKLSLTLSEITQAKNPSIGVATVACKPQFSNVLPTAVCGEVSASCRSSEHLELNKPHIDFNLIQNDGLRTSSKGNCIEKLHNHEQENGPSYKKDTVQPNMHEVPDRTSSVKATCGPFIEKDLDDLGTNKSCISRNTATRESEKPAIDSTVWGSKDLLEFVAHMKNGDVSPISQFDVQTLLLAYIKRNDLRDPRKKSQIICDQRLKSLFGKPRVGHIEMLKLLEFHFLMKADSHNSSFIPAGFVTSMETDAENEGNILGPSMPVNSRKRKTRKKSEDRAPQHDLNEYAAIDAHNINLIYLRRKLMENLLDDRYNINNKVIGSIVRIKLSTNDQKPEVHRLVQVVGTTVAAVPYKIGHRTADFMLEVLNLDKKEIVSIDAISNQEFTEEECRRLRQSVRCGLVKHFTVGEVQKKAVALQSVKVHDWLEAEVSKLNHLRDRASEKGHKKELRECVDRLQLLNSPEEQKRRISEIPKIHSDPRMSPYYESEEDDHVRKDEYVRPSNCKFPRNRRNTKGKEDRSLEMRNRATAKVYSSGSNNVDKNTTQINIGTGGRTDQATQRSGLETSTATSWEGNSPSAHSIETEKLWHYRDPNGKIQGPFSMMQLRKWSKTGLFPPDMRIWTNHEQYDSLLLTDAMSGKYHAASDLSRALLSSAGSKENNPTERTGVAEVLNSTSRDIKQTEATMEVDEPGSSGRPQCLDLLKDGNSSIGDVKECCLPPSISETIHSETIHVDPTNRCQEGEDFNIGSQTGEKNSAGLTPMENEDRAGKPSEENSRSIVSGSVPAPVSEPPDSSKPAETIDVSDLPFPMAKTENQLSEAPATETKPPEFINLSILGWNGDVQLPGVNDEWCGYSPTPTRPSIEEWDPGLLSASPSRPSEVKMEIVDSSSQPVSNKPNWLAITNEPIEFLVLGEDSVSDLFAEVDAMESQGALPSPTAALKFARELLEDSKDDCFSSIEEFSSVSEPRRHDVHLPTSQSSAPPPCKLAGTGTSPVDAFDFCQRSSVNSSASSEGETNAPVHTNHDLVGTSSDPMDPGCGQLPGSTNINLVTVQGNVNLVLGGSPTLGWGTNPGWANSGPNRSPRNGSLAWDGQWKYGGERFSSPREWGYQGGELGFGRGRQPWGRQQYGGGGGGGGYSRPVPKGQRVCKFYEGGHCKKGAYCDYLHP